MELATALRYRKAILKGGHFSTEGNSHKGLDIRH